MAENIGANDLNTLHFSGTDGWAAFPGASYAPEVDWTRFALVGYSKAVDFDAGYLREQFTRTFGNYAQLGGSQGVPTEGEGVLDIVLNGDYTWLQEGAGGPYQREGLMDGIPHTELRKLDMLLIPHGFVKAALARGAHPTMVTTGPRGQQRRFVSVVAQGKYRITATINESDEIENLQTHVANPMFGDMLYENSFGPYQQFGTVSFPSVIRHFVGDPRLYPGHSMMEIEISSVSANEPVATNGVYTISDGSRTLEVRPLPYMTHVATMVIAYLPNERMAVFADTNPQGVMRLGLDTEKYVSLHGGLVSPPE